MWSAPSSGVRSAESGVSSPGDLNERQYAAPLMLQARNIAYANSREMHQSVMKKKILNRY